jgi:hypothetical protein
MYSIQFEGSYEYGLFGDSRLERPENFLGRSKLERLHQLRTARTETSLSEVSGCLRFPQIFIGRHVVLCHRPLIRRCPQNRPAPFPSLLANTVGHGSKHRHARGTLGSRLISLYLFSMGSGDAGEFSLVQELV